MKTKIPIVDRVGISWRGELAAGIISRLADIDVLEIVAESYFKASKRDISALKFIAAQRPVLIHGVSMGLASSSPVKKSIVENMARLIDQIQPELWSEHLAFVRSGDIEIGHLAAPPRTERTIEGAISNIETASKLIGRAPVLENIATLAEPMFSEMDELTWLDLIFDASNSPMLLDLHNLYANCKNQGTDFFKSLAGINLERVQIVHIAGGRLLHCGSTLGPHLWLDDHKSPTPQPVYEALKYLGARTSQPLTVILERDGNFANFEELMAEINSARQALKCGRSGVLHAT